MAEKKAVLKKKSSQVESTNKKNSQKNLKVNNSSWHDFFLGRRIINKNSVAHFEPGMRFVPFFSALAIFVALLASYALGSMNTQNCKTNYRPNVGTMKYLQVALPKDQNSLISKMFPERISFRNSNNLQTQRVLYLIDAQGQSYQVLTHNNINPLQLDGKTVIVTGDVDSCNHTMSLDTLENVIVIPIKQQAQQNPSPVPQQVQQ